MIAAASGSARQESHDEIRHTQPVICRGSGRAPDMMPGAEPREGPNTFSVFAAKKYLNLETYRRNGRAVRTPLWFAADTGPSATLYAYTLANSGKAKRIRRTSVVKIAPCDSRGQTSGPWMDARAEIVTGDEFDHGMQLINRKYRPWKQILDLTVLLFRRRQRIVLAVRPADRR